MPTPGRLIVPVTGTLGTATAESDAASTPTVAGSFSIQRFARTTEGAVAAVGTLTLSLADSASNAARTIVTQIAMPLARSADAAMPGEADQAQPIGAKPAATAPALTQSCETLRLVLGPLGLELPGLAVQLDEVNIDFAVVHGVGERLGNLLCDVAGLSDRAAAPAELVKTLNTLLDTIG